jgi:flavin reductase (DIM6/NTAB) family NADH-FMN oxidoreductase RutF/DNA-binding transcriptional LysR family regulator
MLRQQFLDGMSRAACTVSVITTDGVAGRAGVTVSAMSSISADTPSPSLLVCVHHLSAASAAIQRNGVFCVNVLRDDQHAISDVFAGRTRTASGDKFDCARWGQRDSGAPVLEEALVAFDCHLKNAFQWGSHFIFIGELAGIAVNDPAPPLIYANRAYGTPVPLAGFAPSRVATSAAGAPLGIGCFVTVGPYFLPRLLAAFCTARPEVEVKLVEGNQERLVAALLGGEVALALTYDFDLPSAIEAVPLGEVPPHVLLPAEHPLAAQSRISLHDLAAEPMVLLDIPPSRTYFPSLFAAHGLAPNIRYRSPSFEMVRGMVGHGLGYALLATKPASAMTYDGKALATRPLLESAAASRFVIARHRDAETGGPATEFARLCRAELAAPAPQAMIA